MKTFCFEINSCKCHFYVISDIGITMYGPVFVIIHRAVMAEAVTWTAKSRAKLSQTDPTSKVSWKGGVELVIWNEMFVFFFLLLLSFVLQLSRHSRCNEHFLLTEMFAAFYHGVLLALTCHLQSVVQTPHDLAGFGGLKAGTCLVRAFQLGIFSWCLSDRGDIFCSITCRRWSSLVNISRGKKNLINIDIHSPPPFHNLGG